MMIDQAWILDKWCTAFQAGTHTWEYVCEPARPQSMAFSTTVLREYTLLKYVPNVYQAYGGARTPLATISMVEEAHASKPFMRGRSTGPPYDV